MMIDNERNCSPKMGPRSNDRSPPSISSAMEVENYLDGVHDIFGVDICQVVGRALVDEEYYDNDVVEDNVPSTPRLMSELVTRSSVTYRGGILSPFTSQFLFSRLNHDLLRFDSPIKTQDLPQHRNNEGN
ncbi:hypothetical protein NADFUDRAFT_64263 [Nadsonia fulvescens var. elongata DSM 6958]|nr:hypothetical protein NADFUDRAFT_64263 [Nadsonia fulvescens var. elongata DSM 6958]